MATQHQLLYPFLRQRWRLVGLSVGIGLLNSAVTLLLPLSLGRFYEQFFGGVSNRGQALNTLGMSWLSGQAWSTFFGMFAALIVLRGLLGYANYRLTGTLGEYFVQEMRERVFAHQLALPTATHRQKPIGKYLLRYSSDFGSLRRYLTKGGIGFMQDVLFLTLAGLVLLWLNAPLTGILVFSMLPFLGLLRWINNRLETHTIQRRDLRSGYVAHVATRLAALETIKVFNRESVENEQFAKRSANLTRANRDALDWRSALEGVLPVAVYALIFAVLLGVHALLPNGVSRQTGGILITFILLVLSLRPVFRRLLRVGSVWRTGRLSLNKLADFFAQPAEDTDHRPALQVTKGVVVFDAVSFAYVSGKSVLNDLSLSASAGTITQMPGGPGTGKTTAFNLLLGLYTPSGGNIRIDGQVVSEHSVASVRKHVTLASADVPLLGRTVFEAISYSRKADKRPRAEKLLNELQAITNLPGRLHLDDLIGEQGRNLSEGQRSVLRLTRALLTRKPILLLDEPFAGLTDDGARQLIDWLDQRADNLTILLASNREIGTEPLLPCTHTLISTLL
ncbi:ABC transporter transmembrane domain-containing protein [Spirosoma montaniterrae]|uniref:ABC transporter n=1 Tax=Spirosoma montaniterrae TaxID=1178516 RepID=A0A1P9WTD7_9BACT|nr:ABC transporter ATP-binding protein [Spirosoma montaniterrae]AQG78637.1 hypothetical protein AWR27_04375 [Spirosoma montaniterrae]